MRSGDLGRGGLALVAAIVLHLMAALWLGSRSVSKPVPGRVTIDLIERKIPRPPLVPPTEPGPAINRPRDRVSPSPPPVAHNGARVVEVPSAPPTQGVRPSVPPLMPPVDLFDHGALSLHLGKDLPYAPDH